MATATLDPSAGLTDQHYWDRHWAGPGRYNHRVKHLVRKAFGLGVGPLYEFLAAEIDRVGDESLNVLEVGCAPGRVLARLQSLRPQHHYHGVDFSPEGIRDAQRLFASSRGQVELHEADARLFEPGRRFDFVFSCGLVEHFDDPTEIVAAHARLVAPGGRVVVTMPNFTGAVQEWVIRRLDPETLQSHNLRLMSTDAALAMLDEAGLSTVASGTFGRPTLRSQRTTRGVGPRIVEFAANAANQLTRFVPRVEGLGHYIWASGTSPRAA